MGWLDALERRAREAVGSVPAPQAPTRLPATPQAPPVIRTVTVQTAAPFGDSPGAITVGYYSVQDDVVVMRDGAGKPTGKRQTLAAGQDPCQVAYRLTREAWLAKAPDFWRRSLHYPAAGLA